ncbi:hypothetical protein JJD41_01210 [Oxynema sp. CENA135]|nr:hypothetical protein [Oxynema sp. CENA135]
MLEEIERMGALLAARADDGAQRVLDRLKETNRTEQRPYDREMYKWRHLIVENSKSSNHREPSTSLLLSSGLIDATP